MEAEGYYVPVAAIVVVERLLYTQLQQSTIMMIYAEGTSDWENCLLGRSRCRSKNL
jgi:hypothetical protein